LLVLHVLPVGVVLGRLIAKDGLEAVPVVGSVDVGDVEVGLLVRPEEVEHLGHAEQVELCPLPCTERRESQRLVRLNLDFIGA
jgi:hypothetical protein